MLIYDIEIKKAIPERNGNRIPGIEYCDGWDDHANMGIACIGAYDYQEARYRVFCDDNRDEFLDLLPHRTLIGFNNINFDNAVLATTYGRDLGPDSDLKFYDILQEIWKACGFGTEFNASTHAGYGLDACCKANFHTGKTGYGGTAPVQWQQGKIGAVIDYCLNDVFLTKQIMDSILEKGGIINPKTRTFLELPKP